MAAFKLILSDLDGVIRHYPASLSQEIEREFGLAPGALHRTAFKKDLLDAVTTGNLTDEAWREKIIAELSKGISVEIATQAVMKWSEYPGKLDMQVIELLRRQKGTGQLALLTNATSKLKNDLVALGILNEFDFIFNTCEIGYAKPNRRAFGHVLEATNLAAREILFIDDRFENIAAADTLGLETHHFRSLAILESYFQKSS